MSPPAPPALRLEGPILPDGGEARAAPMPSRGGCALRPCRYQHSLERLRVATTGLQDNKRVFESTLNEVRKQLTATNARAKRSGKEADGGASSKEDAELAVPGPLWFAVALCPCGLPVIP